MMRFSKYLLTCALLTAAVAQPTVYLIRHGEKPDDGNGLNAQGEQRAQCLRNVFGASSQYNIGHIMAQTPKSGMAPGFSFPVHYHMTTSTACETNDR